MEPKKELEPPSPEPETGESPQRAKTPSVTFVDKLDEEPQPSAPQPPAPQPPASQPTTSTPSASQPPILTQTALLAPGSKPEGYKEPDPPPDLNEEYEKALSYTGHGRYNMRVLATCCLVYIYAAIEMMAISFVVTVASCELKLSIIHKSLISSASFLGVCINSLLWGVLSDHHGRRKSMLMAMQGSVISSFLSSFAVGFWSMFLLRFITGIMISGPSAIILVYLAEMETRGHKDRALGICIMSGQMSWIFLTGLAWLIVPCEWSVNLGIVTLRGWRVFMWIWAIIGVAGIFMLRALPESPQWIMAAKGLPAAIQILALMYAGNHKKLTSEFPVGNVKQPLTTGTLLSSEVSWGQIISDIKELFKPPMRLCLGLTSLGMTIVFMLERGLYIWVADIWTEALRDDNSDLGICGLIELVIHASELTTETEDCSSHYVNIYVYPVSLIMETVLVIPFVVVIVFLRRFNKIRMFVVIMGVCTVGQLLSLVPYAMMAVIALNLGISSGAGCIIVQVMASEVFPTSLRGLAVSTLYTAGKLGAVFGTEVVAFFIGPVCYVFMIIFAILTAGGTYLIYRFWPHDIKVVRNEMISREYTY